jgi:hypothetical protein
MPTPMATAGRRQGGMNPARLLLGLLVLMAWPALAQEGVQADPAEPASGDAPRDVRGPETVPASAGESYWSWDFGALYRLSGDPYGPGYPYMDSPPSYFFSLDIARLHSGRSRFCHGLGLGFAAESDSWRMGLSYHFRKELGDHRYLEISPGILFVDSASQADIKWPGLTVQAGLGLSRYFGLVLRVDSRRKTAEGYDWNDNSFDPQRVEYQWTDTSWYGGLRLSSRAGMVASLAAGLVVGAWALYASGW